jgi:DNA-binding transcriptional ArsR family regulator
MQATDPASSSIAGLPESSQCSAADAEWLLDTFRLLANYHIMSLVFKALSDPTRRRVLQLLRRGPLSAGELSDQFNVSKPTMSAHFAVLKEADLVHTEKAGKSVIYHLKLSVLEEALLGFVHSFGVGAKAPKPKKGIAR